MSKIKMLLRDWKVLLMLFFVLLSIYLISPNPLVEGAAIRTVERNSSAEIAGILSSSPNTVPRAREVIISINNNPVKDAESFYEQEQKLPANVTVQVKTNKRIYRLITKVPGDLGIDVYDAPSTNIRKGLDLQGGTRVLLKPERNLPANDLNILITNMLQRLNVFGLTDVVIRAAGDLSGNQFILVEVAGANEKEVKELLAKQGKFEAKIGNETVFVGGEDITFVCREAQCSGIDLQRGCGTVQGGFACGFFFRISLSQEAAERQAAITKNLEVVPSQQGDYLSKPLDLYLDDALVDSLNIAASLQGEAATDISITGSGSGVTQEQAVDDALSQMRRLQTILITGSLPIKLDIVKTDNISPVLGKEFVSNAILMAILAIIAVAVVLVVVYKKLLIAVPILLTMVSEIITLLGFAAFAGWNIDLAAIAGIIVAVGTGVDDQIVITDEIIRGETQHVYGWKQKIKNAFFIIMAAYFTLLVAMVPLFYAGAGLVKGFALTTIVGITIGVLITRPAYARIVEVLLKD